MQQIHAINFAPFAPRGAFAGPEAAGELCRMQELTGTDAGCMQIAGSAAVPNNWELQGAPDPEEQARWYNALLTACQARPWFGGTAFWDWPLPAHAAADRYAFIQGPALDRIRAFYCAGK